MAGENCNINKDEAEILKPSSTSPSPSNVPFLKPEFSPPERQERLEKAPVAAAEAAVEAEADAASASDEVQAPVATSVRFSSRCSSCKKKVGLTGFRCRCGELFCGRHRYSDAHECSFDYKAAGREQISKANPLIRAAKIIKI